MLLLLWRRCRPPDEVGHAPMLMTGAMRDGGRGSELRCTAKRGGGEAAEHGRHPLPVRCTTRLAEDDPVNPVFLCLHMPRTQYHPLIQLKTGTREKKFLSLTGGVHPWN